MLKVLAIQLCLTLCDPMDCSLCSWDSPGKNAPGKNTLQGIPSPGNLSNPGIKPWPPALQADSLSSEPPGKS